MKNFFSPFFKVYSWITFAVLFILYINIPKALKSEMKIDVLIESKPVVLVVIEKRSQLESYQLAQNTVACYCKMHGYKFIQIIYDESLEMQKHCSNIKRIWFQRLCVAQKILQQNPDISHLFYIDADMGVINPKHRLEEYINPKYDLLFYERTGNYDIMTGSFIIKNTQYSFEFLEDWLKLEHSFGFNDQAAVHQMFLNRFYPNHPKKEKCEAIWNNSNNDTSEGFDGHAACLRSIMNDKLEFDTIVVYPKASREVWARDIWLTKSKWAPRDFMLHDMEQHRISNDPEDLKDFMYYPNPFLSDAVFHTSLCTISNGSKCWKYNTTLITTDEFVEDELVKKADEVRERYLNLIKTL